MLVYAREGSQLRAGICNGSKVIKKYKERSKAFG